ncbi:EnvZ/OmpR regulon moderator MzrA [Intestinirhabdus alba]|jgi:hypothetical protein|uniref:Modulator protein MzrA n=1 Tax=Intestinirhabdus alba TaxID=2899544 RepID=A0A6L6IJ93_9ENTR|nr:EnvZ/OmpR regulon moderator MzrA [Intestinirhabdus alba]MTH45778.1 EnvZ/OmpR regulon moderator MzrA [Intestinirhabdus alba]
MLKPRITLRQLAWATSFLTVAGVALLFWSAIRQPDATLAIRAIHHGASAPDGFSVWHHLDANGIHFKSITPQNDALLITFDTRAQSAAAKVVLSRTLPRDYVIAQQNGASQAEQWLTRMRISAHRFG